MNKVIFHVNIIDTYRLEPKTEIRQVLIELKSVRACLDHGWNDKDVRHADEERWVKLLVGLKRIIMNKVIFRTNIMAPIDLNEGKK